LLKNIVNIPQRLMGQMLEKSDNKGGELFNLYSSPRGIIGVLGGA
jgi:hypothetical protein